ncbi:MAG: hypothetical protein FJZ43_00555 [Candidatus Staskawiczbacteria bacterium]|nr:hypothetical protein [Candidatus Staskawiczbacteria bacterium]
MIGALIIAFFSLILLMIIHEYGHFIIAKKFGARIDEFGIGYPPKIFGIKFGETEYSINLIPLGAFVRIYGEEGGVDDYRSFSKLSIFKRILIVLGGVIAFWVAAAIIFSVAFSIGATVPIGDQDVVGVSNTSIQILEVVENSPAKVAGLEVGDKILSLELGEKNIIVKKVSDFQLFTKDNSGKEITVVLEREGKIVTTTIVPRVEYPEGQGPTGISIERMANVIEKYPWYQAPIQGTIYTGKVTIEALKGIYGFFASLFSGNGVPVGAELAGPVGITIFLSQAVSLGVGFFLYFVGSLSVLLAIFNLFPIPALDGGKLLFLIIEAVKRKPVSIKIEQVLTIVFFVLLISMSIFITIKFDVPRVMDLWAAGLK